MQTGYFTNASTHIKDNYGSVGSRRAFTPLMVNITVKSTRQSDDLCSIMGYRFTNCPTNMSWIVLRFKS